MTDAAYHLSRVLPVAGVYVDEIFLFGENGMAQLSGFVVVHTSEQNYPLCFRDTPIAALEKIRDSKLEQFFLAFHKARDIFAFDAESGGIAFCQYLRFISADVLFHKVLTD